jgi:type IV pilus secretin PilQ/predicted competence protein
MRTRPFELALILLASVVIGRSQPAPAVPAASPEAPAIAPKPADVPAAVQAPAVAPKPADVPAAVQTPAVAPKPADAPAPAVQTTDASASGASRSKDTLSVDYPDEDIRTVLRNVADLFELNLVIPPALQGKTSIKLHDVTWHQVFDVVLTPVGYTFVDDSGIIKIVSLESLAEEPVATEVFVLSYSKASEVQTVLTTLIDSSKGGKLTLDARSNSLIVTERPSRLNKMRPIIKQLDKATDQVMIESKFVEVTTNDIKNIGVDWSSLNSYGISAGPFSSTATRTNGTNTSDVRTLTNADSPYIQNGYAQAGQVIGQANGAPMRLVPPYSIDSTTGLKTYSGFGPSSTWTAGTNSAESQISSAVFNADQFKVLLSALQTNNMTKVVSNPTVVTLNNTEAIINVGEEDPIPNYTYNQEHGSFEVSGFEYKPIGIILKVTPQVNASGFIKLNLEPEVSQKNGTVNFGGAAGAEIPIIATRKAKTQVSMKDGFTMAIGGLIRTQTIRNGDKVPVLGSIPVIGRLFSNSSKEKDVNNLIIFITAKVLNSEGARPEEIINPDQIRNLEMQREELPGYRGGPDPFLKSGSPDNLGK